MRILTVFLSQRGKCQFLANGSSEKLPDFEIICPSWGCEPTPAPNPVAPERTALSKVTFIWEAYSVDAQCTWFVTSLSPAWISLKKEDILAQFSQIGEILISYLSYPWSFRILNNLIGGSCNLDLSLVEYVTINTYGTDLQNCSPLCIAKKIILLAKTYVMSWMHL